MSEPSGPSGSGLPPHLDPRRGTPRRTRGATGGTTPGATPPRRPVTPPPNGRPPGAASTLPPHLNPRGPAAARTATPLVTGSGARSRSLPPRRRGRRILKWTAGITAGLVLLAGIGGYVLYTTYDLKTFDIPGFDKFLEEPPPGGSLAEGSQNFLLVGSDTREGLKAGEGPQGTGEDFVTGQRSDTMILVHLSKKRDVAQVVSFPRDLYVTIPAHTNEAGEAVPERMNKLNSAFEAGGPSLLVQTLEMYSGIDINHYVEVNFNGFKKIVEAVGGVEVCLPRPAKDKLSGIDLPAGRHTLDGDTALAYVRQRHGLPRGDIDRVIRQQQFMGSVFRKAKGMRNPIKADRLIRAGISAVTVDKGLDLKDLAELGLAMDPSNILFSELPVVDISYNPPGPVGSTVRLDDAGAEEIFRQIREDEPPVTKTSAAPVPSDLIVRPGAIRIRVFNGTDTQGLGRRAAADLTKVGFILVEAPGNRGVGTKQTVVRHGPSKADSARTLSAAIPGSITQEDPTLGRTLEVIVGSDYSGARAVTVKPPAAKPAGGGTASAAPKPRTAAEDPCAV